MQQGIPRLQVVSLYRVGMFILFDSFLYNQYNDAIVKNYSILILTERGRMNETEKAEYQMEYDGNPGGRISCCDSGGSSSFMAAGQQSEAHHISGCVVYGDDVGMRDRTCDGDACDTVYIIRQGGTSDTDPDRRSGSDCLCDRIFYYIKT